MEKTTDSHPRPAGYRTTDPHGCGRLIVLRSAGQTGGGMLEIEAICEPGRCRIEERSFARHEVSFEVLDGRLMVGVEGFPRTLRPGQSLDLDAGTPHRIWVEPDDPAARFIWRMRPAPSGADPLDLVFGAGRGQELDTPTDVEKRGQGATHAEH